MSKRAAASFPRALVRRAARVLDDRRNDPYMRKRKISGRHAVQNVRIALCTTDVHLPRRIGRALERAHDGELSMELARDACRIHVGWRR